MKFIGVRDFRTRTANIWQTLESEREMVITSNGKPVALLTAVGEDDFEQALRTLRRARAMSAAEAVQSRSVGAGLNKMGLNRINEIIQASRKEKRDDAHRS